MVQEVHRHSPRLSQMQDALDPEQGTNHEPGPRARATNDLLVSFSYSSRKGAVRTASGNTRPARLGGLLSEAPRELNGYITPEALSFES
jgi:hypothetical protein